MVERYNCHGWDIRRGEMRREDDGQWVSHSDYATLERQIAELRAEVDTQRESKEFAQRCCEKAEAENARLRALPLKDEVERVLEPFARESERWEPKGDVYWPDAVPFPASSISGIKIGDLRAARALLSRLRAGEQDGWRSMDSAPKDGGNILYRTKFKDIGFCHWDEGYNDDEYPCWWDNERDDEVCPIAWLPADTLPDFPAARDLLSKTGRTGE